MESKDPYVTPVAPVNLNHGCEVKLRVYCASSVVPALRAKTAKNAPPPENEHIPGSETGRLVVLSEIDDGPKDTYFFVERKCCRRLI
jgi:hypothetical protein